MSILLCIGQLLIGAGIFCLLVSLFLYLRNRQPASASTIHSTAGPATIEPATGQVRLTWQAPAAPGSAAKPPASSKTGDPMQAKFTQARLGQTITVTHPQRGPITGNILGTIHYTELTQKRNAPAEPWVATGNTFVAHWFGSFLIYRWQDRLYLLDELEPLTDQEVQTRFMPYAKRFAQSDQTAQVVFDWPPASWVIKDIGKFSVAQTQGSGLRLNPGAVGRFIHGEGADRRAIVVEDYQSGSGGQDTAWTGWTITWEDLTRIS